MRNLFFFSLLLTTLLTSCDKLSTHEASWSERTLKGEHKLRKMNSKDQFSAYGSYFLFSGEMGASTHTFVTFSWQMNDTAYYAINILPIEKIRVKVDENVKSPTIEFAWQDSPNEDLQWNIDQANYATITVRSEDWPIDVNLPMNQEKK